MPAAVQYIPPTDERRGNRLTAFDLDEEKRRRRAAIKTAFEYYKGDQKKQLDEKEGEPTDNVVLNHARVVVDRTLQFLFPEQPKFQIDPLNPDRTQEELWIDGFWAENGSMAKMTEIGMNGALSGHCYVRVLPPTGIRKYPRVVNLNPAQMTTYWAADDIETVLWHEQQYTAQQYTAQDFDYVIDYINLGATWKIVKYARPVGGGAWKIAAQDDWQWAAPPVIAWPHLPMANEYYGGGELQNLAIHDAINLIVSEWMRINRYHSSPKTVATGVDPDEIVATAIDGLWSVENADADVYNLEMKGSAIEATGSLLDRLTNSLLAENRVVVLKGNIADFQRVTNPGIKTAFMDAIAKNELLRWTYGNAISMITYVASLVGRRPLSAVPTIIWPDPLPSDELVEVQINEKKLAMCVTSRADIAARDGKNFTEIAVQLAREGKALSLISKTGVDKQENDGTINSEETDSGTAANEA